MIPRGEFVLVVVSVKIRPQIDVALRAPERAEEFAQVFGLGIPAHHCRDHEGRIDDLAEAELLREVVRTAEQGRRLRLALDQLIEPVKQHAVGKGQVDLVSRHILLERLDGRVVAARLIAHGDRNAREILRRAHRRVGRDEDACRGDRVHACVEATLALGGCDADGPVTGAAHVGGPAALE